METPVASSGPMLRRAATFSHRTERALKDVNGRLGLVNKSQEQGLTSKTTMDVQKLTRPTKQYSAVASRYAAPLTSKKPLSNIADGAHGGHANVTKLPFITGKSASHHQRRPSSDNLSSFQPPAMFAAIARDVKANTLAKKAEANGNSSGSKLSRVGVRASMIEKKSPAQTRAPRFLSLDKGGCTCSMNGAVRSSVDSGSASLLYSAAHWLSLIKLAEGEKKHEVVVDLFRLAITLKAEPGKDVFVQLKRYQESCSSDKVVSELVQLCEGTQPVCLTGSEVVDKAVCEPEDVRNTISSPTNDVSDVDSVTKITIVPPVVSESEALVKEAPAKKAPHIMGRMLSRSATFSVVDAESKSQHAKAEYGKKLAKTLEFLATQGSANSPSTAEAVDDSSPSKTSSSLLACVPEAEISDDQATPGFKVASKILDLALKIGSKLVVPASENFSSPLREAGSGSLKSPSLGNGSAEKPVDSLSGWLDGDPSEIDTPDVQSALTVDSVDLRPKSRGAVLQMDVDSLTKQVSDSLPEAIAKLPADSNAVVAHDRPRNKFHVRRKSWQDAGELPVTEIVESISRSHRHSFSAEAIFLSAPGSVEKKVKLFTGLAEVKPASPGITEPSPPGSDSKERHEAEGVKEHIGAVEGNKDISQSESLHSDFPVKSPIKILSAVDTPVEIESAAKTALETKSAAESLVSTDSKVVQSEGSKVPLATPLGVSMKERSKKGDAVPLPIPATPSAATPCEPASVTILKARHRRSSSVGNMTPRGPFDLMGERSPFGDSPSSPSGQSSSAKSKRMSRGYKEVTSRMDLPKPSWKAIVEREMKGSKLKELLVARLPDEGSPNLAEYIQRKMENQNRDPESGSKENDANSMCSPDRSVRKMTRSSSMKKPAVKEEKQEVAAEPSSAQKQKKQDEDEQELDTSTNGCPTPGSAVRRSARIQKKVQAKRDMVF